MELKIKFIFVKDYLDILIKEKYITKEDSVIVSSFNRDSFLLKVRDKGIKLTNIQECLIASV